MKKSNEPISAIKQDLINARDDYYDILNKALSDETISVLTLKSNMPGVPKNTWYTRVILEVMNTLIKTLYKEAKSTLYESLAGNYYIYTLDEDPKALKQAMIELEDNHPLGRFADLDVHAQHKTYSRISINKERRTCYLCNEPAHACTRSQSHTYATLRQHILARVQDYLIDTLAEEVALAMRKEVFLYPKFGLVSNKDSGAHTDMDISHFLTSIKTLKPYMREFIEAGFNIEAHLDVLRHIGQEAEAAMFDATNNINTHKGAIFIFGAFLPFYTSAIVHKRPLESAIKAMQVFIDTLIKDDFNTLNHKTNLTAGEIIYQKYGLKGIRAEVLNGFKSVMHWYPKDAYSDYQKLCALMARVEDTTIIKRFNYKILKDVQEEMHALLNETPFNMAYYKTLSDQYKQKGISPGGSADLLSLVFFLDKTRYLLPH